MSTHSGTGTMYYGWRHATDGTSTATKWATIFYVPIIPLRREKLIVKTDYDSEGFWPERQQGGFYAGTPVMIDYYEILDRTGLSGKEILRTYLYTYILGPILLLWPCVIMFAYAELVSGNEYIKDSVWSFVVVAILSGLAFGNLAYVSINAIRRSRGMGRKKI